MNVQSEIRSAITWTETSTDAGEIQDHLKDLPLIIARTATQDPTERMQFDRVNVMFLASLIYQPYINFIVLF